MMIVWVKEMVKIPEEGKAVFSKQRVIPIATVSSDGKPHEVYFMFWWWVDDEHMAIVENLFHKTHENLVAKGWASISAYDMSIHRAYQIKCKAEYLTSGALYDVRKQKMEEIMKGSTKKLPARAVWLLKTEEIYWITPSPETGNKIA
jgi:predicted pyridoxine 5'-phosphate oxidase superfamily flavin-nucleotide-binding protein